MTDLTDFKHPKLLIEEWLPAQALGVECMRERGSASALAPNTFLHVWWARRPLAASRAAVLASLLPAGFDRAVFERLVGFGRPSRELVEIRGRMDMGVRVEGSFGCGRAFTNVLNVNDVTLAHAAMRKLWGEIPTTIDPMAGGGSIPLEAARLGLNSLANEYNPVACTILEATVDYPFRFGADLGPKIRKWAKIWNKCVSVRLAPYYPKEPLALVHAYIYARTVPCPDTGFQTPLCPDWTLLTQKGKLLVAQPSANVGNGRWSVTVREVGKGAGQLRQAPPATYSDGKGVSLFSGTVIPADYIKAVSQNGEMRIALYAVATKTTSKLSFRPAEAIDLDALQLSERELGRLRLQWERDGVLPTEMYPEVSSDERPRLYGMPHWADLFAPRQLLSLGVLVEELNILRTKIVNEEGIDAGEAIITLLSAIIDKYANHNCSLSKWENTRGVVKGKFDRHDFAFRTTFAELAPCIAGEGLAWTTDNVTEAFEKLAALPRTEGTKEVAITQGSAANLQSLDDKSVTAVIVDPPYADNVQYSELADFFYVWLKRTQGHRHPDWYSTYLCDHDDEAVVNGSRFRRVQGSTGEAKALASEHYQSLMTAVFQEAKRILRDDGPLTVMFTHKKQEAWSALFQSLIEAGFIITATWPVQTESQHSLHQAKKNAAQSTVILVARKRDPSAGVGYLDDKMRFSITNAAQVAAARMKEEGLNAVDQLVGAFGPAMAVFTHFKEVRTDTGLLVNVADAIQLAANAVAEWRVDQVAERGLEGVDAESRFALLCWDVLGAAQFRFNEAMLLGRAVGMDVNRLKETGLISASGDKVGLLSAMVRRRDRPVRDEQEQLNLFGADGKRTRKKLSRQVHPNDEYFVSAIDMCHVLALKYSENGGGQAGIGAAKGTAIQQGWDDDSACAKLMTALVSAAPLAVRFTGKGKVKTAADDFPEFRAWHAMLEPLFRIKPPEWVEPMVVQSTLALDEDDEGEAEE